MTKKELEEGKLYRALDDLFCYEWNSLRQYRAAKKLYTGQVVMGLGDNIFLYKDKKYRLLYNDFAYLEKIDLTKSFDKA